MVVAPAATVVVVFTGFVVGVVVVPAAFVLPLSTCCSSTIPMITAKPISSAPLAAAKLAPRAMSPPDAPPEGRFIRSFCPLGPLGALTGSEDRPADPRYGRDAPAHDAGALAGP